MNKAYYLFSGAWSNAKNPAVGVKSFAYDVEAQKLSYIGTFGEYLSMSCIQLDGDLLFACVESKQDDLLVSFRIRPDGTLQELGTVHSGGASIAHLDIDTKHRRLFTANFKGLSVSMVEYDEAGTMTVNDCYKFTDPGSYVTGYGPTERQDAAYPHAVKIMPDGDHLCVCNMGNDKIYIFEIDWENGKLILCPNLTVTIDGGEGARHLVFSPDGKFAYMNTEMGSTVYAFSVGEDASLTRLQKLSTLDPEKENPPKGWASVIIVSSDGKYAYVGNRGQSNIVGYKIGEDGLLTEIGHFDCYGDTPRGLNFGYRDEVIFCSCNVSGTISVIDIDKETGKLGGCRQLIGELTGSANVVFTAL